MTLRNRLPLVFAMTFAGVIALFSFQAVARWHGAMRIGAASFLGCYLLWLLLESKVAIRERSKGDTRVDRGTCEAYAAGRALTVLMALLLPSAWTEPGLWMPVGFALLLSGVALRTSAIRTLGRFYSHRVRIMGDHRVVEGGPYRLVRHPAYTGMLVAHAGVVTFFFNPYTLAAFLFTLLPSMVARIRLEERALFDLRGYSEYANRKSRLLPLIW